MTCMTRLYMYRHAYIYVCVCIDRFYLLLVLLVGRDLQIAVIGDLEVDVFLLDARQVGADVIVLLVLDHVRHDAPLHHGGDGRLSLQREGALGHKALIWFFHSFRVSELMSEWSE